MADNEIKKVITVDLGNTKTYLKDYKKHIDELRASLLNLDKTSEEYKNISKQIAEEQNKLNEVMSIGKKDTDAADGSYNKLVQTMNELKKQWKATADETERAELGKKILDINNQLKELDASTGNFQRNVGDYANAFEKAFDKCLDGIIKIDGPLGEIGGTVKNMLPVIKNINSTALRGLSGIKKGIASTGIGLLVIAVSELITHWKDLIKIVGISDEQFADFKETALSTLQNIIITLTGVGNAIGNFLLTPIRATIESFKGLGNIVKDIFTGNWSKIKEDAENAFNGIGNALKKGFDFKTNYGIGLEVGYQFTEGVKRAFNKDIVEEETVEEIGHTIGKTITKGIEEELDETEKTIDSNTQSILDRLHKRYTDELELLREKYEEEKALLEQYGLDTTQLQQEFEEEAEKIIDKRLDAEQKAIVERQKAEEEAMAKQKKADEDALKLKKMQQKSLISSTSAMFGALSDLAEEGSEEQKAFAIMETIINTLQSIMGTWAGYSEMGPWGVAAAAVQTAALAATGAATIAKMKSTTKDSSSASVSAPQVQTPSMTSVTPLLDETSDINRMDMSGLQGNSTQEQTIKCYVVESEINEVQNKVKVTEQNATF